MTSPYLTRAQAWCFALRTLMNYPADAPQFPTKARCSSSPRNVIQLMELAEIATDTACDLVHVAVALDVGDANCAVPVCCFHRTPRYRLQRVRRQAAYLR